MGTRILFFDFFAIIKKYQNHSYFKGLTKTGVVVCSLQSQEFTDPDLHFIKHFISIISFDPLSWEIDVTIFILQLRKLKAREGAVQLNHGKGHPKGGEKRKEGGREL